MTCDRCGEWMFRLITVPGMCYCPRCDLAKADTADEFGDLWIEHGGEA